MPVEIAPEWMTWLAENELRGVDTETLVKVLVGAGLDEDGAVSLVEEVRRSPLMRGAHNVLRRSAATEQAARLHRTFANHHSLELHDLDEPTFHTVCWTAHRPVVLRGGAAHWKPWSLDDLRTRYADVEIEALEGRTKHERWWRHREELATPMTVGTLLDRMQTESGNDLYGVGRNDVLAKLEGLEDEVGTLPGIDPERRHMRLWIGPAGTLTPLHHDQSSAWLVQRVGRKRVWIASPLEPALFDTAEGVFNLLDPRDPPDGDVREVHWWETVLESNDAMFLPAGWWHMVLAETPSVSVSLGGFRWPHNISWYAPAR